METTVNSRSVELFHFELAPRPGILEAAYGSGPNPNTVQHFFSKKTFFKFEAPLKNNTSRSWLRPDWVSVGSMQIKAAPGGTGSTHLNLSFWASKTFMDHIVF